jgi:hypothetical protein
MGRGRMSSVSSPKWREIVESMHGQQRAFTECWTQGAIACAGRGAGKSYAVAAKFHRPSAAHPGCSSVFVTQSAARSRDILLPGIWKLNEKFGLGIVESVKHNAAVWPNGYRVLMRGCKDNVESNKRRGTPWVLAGWDECDAINSSLLERDIHDAVEPRLADYDGRWFATGTPGPILQGYWHKLSCGEHPHYPMFHWTALDNPHIEAEKYFIATLQRAQSVPPRETWPAGVHSLIDIIRNQKHWHLLPAAFVREYLGKWVTDIKSLIYRITPRNTFSELPIEPDYWTIGVDLGAHSEENPNLDYAAITVACSNRTLPFVWVLRSFRMSDVTVDSIAQRLLELLVEYPQAAVHIDSSSAGKIIESTLRKMGIPIQAALKGPKLRRIQLLQSHIANGMLQLHALGTMDLRTESTSLVWNDKRDNHSERCTDDCWDSAHYAVCPHIGDYRPEPEETKPPEVGSPEWHQAQELAEYEQALQEAQEAA